MNFSGINQEKLFFIIGHGRSGTSLLQSIMNTFNGFCNDIEARIMPEEISCYKWVKKNGDFSFLENFIRKNWTKEFFVEKTPNSIFSLSQLHHQYPKANYLFLERNPLKIMLSRMNYAPPPKSFEEQKKIRLLQENLTGDDLNLNQEQWLTKLILTEIKVQVKHKPKFKNQITIRYENFINHLEDHILSIQNKFKISSDIDLAKQILSKPSKSSKNNRYNIKKLTDETAIEWIKEACILWNYEFDYSAIDGQNL